MAAVDGVKIISGVDINFEGLYLLFLVYFLMSSLSLYVRHVSRVDLYGHHLHCVSGKDNRRK
jgi:hypothetical protein